MELLFQLVITVQAKGTWRSRAHADPLMSCLVPDIPTLARDALRPEHELSIVLAVELIGVKLRFIDRSGRVDAITRRKRVHVVLRSGPVGCENVAVRVSRNVGARLCE